MCSWHHYPRFCQLVGLFLTSHVPCIMLCTGAGIWFLRYNSRNDTWSGILKSWSWLLCSFFHSITSSILDPSTCVSTVFCNFFRDIIAYTFARNPSVLENLCNVLYMLIFYGKVILAPRQAINCEDHLFSTVRDCLFTIFVATIHIWRLSSYFNKRMTTFKLCSCVKTCLPFNAKDARDDIAV